MGDSISSSSLSSSNGMKSNEKNQSHFFLTLSGWLFFPLRGGQKKLVSFINKMQDPDIKEQITSLAKAIFYGGYFILSGAFIITLGILKPHVITRITLLFPLLYLSLTIQMIFWISIGTLAIWLGAAVFVRECPPLRSLYRDLRA